MKRLLLSAFVLCLAQVAQAANPANPILFVTQVPMPEEVDSIKIVESYMSCVSPFANHLADTAHAGRGGSLYIRFSNAQVIDLLSVADWSAMAGGKPAVNTVAVRHPSVNWAADKAMFSMVIGAPSGPADTTQYLWQLYETTLPTQAQLNAGTKPVITKVANQPAYNNIFPTYALGGKVIFVSDRPYNGQAHLLQREEYLSLLTVTGLWSFDPASAGSLKLLHHAASGAFAPRVDSAGRVVFTNWDHLARDRHAVYDNRDGIKTAPYNETFTQTNSGSGNYDDESATSTFTPVTAMANDTWEIFPEPRNFDHKTLIDVYGSSINGNALNIFLPWMINPDGTAGELLNHIGRQEIGPSITKSYANDTNLVSLAATTAPGYGGLTAHKYCNNVMSIIEDPLRAGSYLAADAGNFGTHGAGQIIRLDNAGVAQNADGITVTYLTTGYNNASKPAAIPLVKPSISLPATGQVALTNPETLYRTPTPLADGSLVASQMSGVNQTDYNVGTLAQPLSRYTFRLMSLKLSGTAYVADVLLTSGLNINTSYYVGSTLTSYNGAAWELDPAEVAPRVQPPAALPKIDPIETAVFTANGVDLPTLQSYLISHNAALSICRDVTKRDRHDRQQPFNLNVSWSGHQTVASGTTGLYQVAWQQFLQADLRRGGLLGGATPAPGRRPIATPMHDTPGENPPVTGAPTGAVRIGDDGSVAAIVPAGKALTWHLLANDTAKTSQVKERFWITFQPGEVRTCVNCHGVNTFDQTGAGPPTNSPQALATLLQYWKGNHPPGALQHALTSIGAVKSAGSVTVNLTRTGGSTGPVSVNFATVAGTALPGQDYTSATGTVSWADGDTAPKPITIALLGNPTIASSKSFTVQLTSPLNGTLGAATAATVTVAEPPYEAWLFSKFGAAANNSALYAPTADADGDGISNLAEYAFNTDPASASSTPLPQSALERDPTSQLLYLTLSYHRRKTSGNLTYHAESATAFGAWHEGALYVTELSALDDGNGLTDAVKIRAVNPVGSTPVLFLRVRVDKPVGVAGLAAFSASQAPLATLVPPSSDMEKRVVRQERIVKVRVAPRRV